MRNSLRLILVTMFLSGIGLLVTAWVGTGRPMYSWAGHLLIVLPLAVVFVHLLRQHFFYRAYYVPPSIPFINEKTDVRLDIQDRDGRLASYMKRQVCLVREDGVTGYRMTNLSTDGSIENLKILSPHRHFTVEPRTDHTYDLYVELDRVYYTGERFDRCVGFDFVDSFKEATEYFKVSFVFPASIYTIRVTWPKAYGVTDVRAEEEYPLDDLQRSTVVPLTIRELDDDSRICEHQLRRPLVGSRVRIVWERTFPDAD